MLRLGGASLLYTMLGSPLAAAASGADAGAQPLFLTPDNLSRLRANVRTPLLRPLFETWAQAAPDALYPLLEKFAETQDRVRDFSAVMMQFEHDCVLHLVQPDPVRTKALCDTITQIASLPYWDYFRDGGTEVLGIQRASMVTVRFLFAREALGDDLPPELERKLMQAVADIGCAECARTLYDMDHPETVRGWSFDTIHADFMDIDMRRWPTILGGHNLRSAPTGALGLGALALRGRDPRAEEWLEMAVGSFHQFLRGFSPDGSYFEGLSYLEYSLRTALPFIDAHRRLIGDVDWLSEVNWDGTLDYVLYMQLGKHADGSPDIVNFSDARRSIFPGAVSLLGAYTGNPLAGFAAQYAGDPTWFYDFLWYRPEAPSEPPPPRLKNMRNDLNWIVCRSGWGADDAVIAFRSGGPANHEHADRNHITFKAFGERLLNDHVGASYDYREPAWKLRQTEAHNAVLIDGQGQIYVDGHEGVNESDAYATILQYEDHGERVWWTSDATAAYRPKNYHLQQVLRTVLFAKPGVLVVVDQVHFRYRPFSVDARFYPDNADGQARLEVEDDRFTLTRPHARLHGLVASDVQAAPRLTQLDLPMATPLFACVEVHAPPALRHHLITVLAATPGADRAAPPMRVERDGDRWKIRAGDLRAEIRTTSHSPEITLL